MTGRNSTQYQVFGKKNQFTMVSTSRIKVFGVKPDLHFSFVINSFHNDLFSQGIQRGFLYFRKRHSCIRQEAPRKHPGGTQEAPRRHPGSTQEAPSRHPGGTQEASRSPGSFRRHLSHKSSPLLHQMQKVPQIGDFVMCFWW